MHSSIALAIVTMPSPGPVQGRAAGAPRGVSPSGSARGSSPKWSHRSDELGAAGGHSTGSLSEQEEHPTREPLPPHVARLTRQSIELIEQAREAALHSTTQLPPAPQLPP